MKLELIKRLRTCKHAPAMVLCHNAADEIERLYGERRVIADLFDEAIAVVHTVEGDNDDEEAKLRDLQDRMERMSLHARGITPNAD